MTEPRRVGRWTDAASYGARWSRGPGEDADPASLAIGPNMNRRWFIELVLGAVGGAALVGLAPTTALASGKGGAQAPVTRMERPPAHVRGRHVTWCDGEQGFVPADAPAMEVLEYEDLPALSRAA